MSSPLGPRHVERAQWQVRERRYLTAVLTRRGESAPAIAVRIGVTARTVQRYRTQIRQHQNA